MNDGTMPPVPPPIDRPVLTAAGTKPGSSPVARRRLGTAVILLILSALVFCVVVVRQRDVRLKRLAIAEVREVQKWVGDFLAIHRFLPPKLPEDRTFFASGQPALAYPTSREIVRLRGHSGTIMLVAGPRCGMITPGGDGYAVLLYDAGKVSTQWISPKRFDELRRQRNQMLTLNP